MTDTVQAQESSPEDQAAARQAQIDRLEAFSQTISKLRQAAIVARSQSGIEDQWQEDEDHYESIDNANRTTAARIKPYDFGGTGSGPTKTPEKNINRSTVFVPMTRPYVDIAAARISDMYMPTDDRNWDGEPTPIPDLTKALDDTTPVADQSGQSIIQGHAPVMGQNQQQVVGPDGQPITAPVARTVADQAKEVMEEANKSWERARTQIDDWTQECNYNAELRLVIHDMARIGVGIIKGPFPKSKMAKAVMRTASGFSLEIEKKIIPSSKRVDPWNFYPDGACGEKVKNGSHLFERDLTTRSDLRDLKAEGLGYITSQIDLCLEEGPMSAVTGTTKSNTKERNEADLFEIWFFEGQVEWQDLQDAGCDCGGQKGDVFHGMVTMVNNHVIKASISHLDSGEFTYDVGVWQRKAGLWIGDGVGRQGRTAQQGVNAAVRNLMDNAGQSSRPHKVINTSAINPGMDPWTWSMAGDSTPEQVAHAMMFFSVPSMQQDLMAIIAYFQKMFEDSTGLPMLLQGQQGSAPETVGGMEMLQNNAGIVPRNMARMLDDRITEPHIKRYYEYLLIHGEDDSAKGEFNIHARGSSALMERASQDQFLLQIAQFVLNPAYGLDPELYIDELLKSKRINPERLKLSDEKKKAMASQPPPEDPRITAAKITVAGWTQREQVIAQGKEQVEQIKAAEGRDHAAADAHLAMNQQAFEQSEAEKDRRNAVLIEMIAERMNGMDLQSAEAQTLGKIKSDLAKESMALNTQKDLSLAGHIADLHKHHNPAPQVLTPPTEPVGRAEPGQAFAQ